MGGEESVNETGDPDFSSWANLKIGCQHPADDKNAADFSGHRDWRVDLRGPADYESEGAVSAGCRHLLLLRKAAKWCPPNPPDPPQFAGLAVTLAVNCSPRVSAVLT